MKECTQVHLFRSPLYEPPSCHSHVLTSFLLFCITNFWPRSVALYHFLSMMLYALTLFIKQEEKHIMSISVLMLLYNVSLPWYSKFYLVFTVNSVSISVSFWNSCEFLWKQGKGGRASTKLSLLDNTKSKQLASTILLTYHENVVAQGILVANNLKSPALHPDERDLHNPLVKERTGLYHSNLKKVLISGFTLQVWLLRLVSHTFVQVWKSPNNSGIESRSCLRQRAAEM